MGKHPQKLIFKDILKLHHHRLHQMIVKLESLGFISKIPRVARSIKVLIQSSEIPELKELVSS